ncbi:hypothetical protein ACS0TY_025926 [Phlomoides rotata]
MTLLVLAKFATDFSKVQLRLCADEAELAKHVVGLTCSLSSCQFRKRLTRLLVNANGSVIPKDCTDKKLIKKNLSSLKNILRIYAKKVVQSGSRLLFLQGR